MSAPTGSRQLHKAGQIVISDLGFAAAYLSRTWLSKSQVAPTVLDSEKAVTPDASSTPSGYIRRLSY